MPLLSARQPTVQPGGEIPLDNGVLLFTIVVSIITAHGPRGADRRRPQRRPQTSGRTGSDSGTKRRRSVLVAAEVALVADSSGRSRLMIRSLWI